MMRHVWGLLVAGGLLMNVPPVQAQTRNGPRATLARANEIALARTAAPAAISAKARVWVWQGDRYVVADSGQSAINCYVGRPWSTSLEPHCFDEEAVRTIMPILMRKTELYATGKNDADVDREIASGLLTGKFKLPQRPAVTFMMSASQKLVTGDGQNVGAWEPHLMIYYPYLKAEEAGIPGFVPGVGFVENPGHALATLVVPLKTFVNAQP